MTDFSPKRRLHLELTLDADDLDEVWRALRQIPDRLESGPEQREALAEWTRQRREARRHTPPPLFTKETP